MSKKKPDDKPSLQFKAFAFDVKTVAEEPDEDGMVYVPAYGSVFNVLDSHDDMTVKGTFAATLDAWAEKGAPIPAHFNHSLFSTDPMDNVGFLSEASEDDHGLKLMVGLDVAHNTKAAYLHRLIKQKRLRELSIGYIPKAWENVKRDGARSDWDTYRKLTEVDLLEVSFVSVASNSEATVLEKAARLLYGSPEEDPDTKDDDISEEVDSAATLLSVAESLLAVAESLKTLGAAKPAAKGDEDPSPDGDDPEGDDSDQEAGTKAMSVRARAVLANIALFSAETE